jgi:zinc protease
LSRTRDLEPESHTLANGLRLLMVEDHRAPVISMQLTALAGSGEDAESLAGTALMASRLLEEGTRSRSSLEIADAIESVGGAIDTDCSYDRLSVLLGVLSRDIGLGIDLVADMVRNPVFSEESIGNERERTLAEIQSAMDRPQVVAGWEFNELVYRDHPLHRPVHGYPETIPAIRRSHLEEFHRRSLRPNRTIVAVSGDFAAAEMRERVESAFGAWEAAPREARPPAGLPSASLGVTARFVPVSGQQAHVYLGHLGIERTHPDFYTLQVMDAILGAGAGLTARIPRRLRDEQGLAYTTFASITNSAGRVPGKFVAYIGTAPAHVEQAVAGFLAEIETIRSVPVSGEELADAQDYLTGSFVFAFESNAQVARFLVNAEVYELGFDYLASYPGRIRGVTASDLCRAAEAHLSTENYVLVVAGPEEARGTLGL